mmetsp:Transcript_62800/g.141857  ORF Transcript_62800/g.141857 Transcript_62800/m.141857 type:complete len:322 (-) Transcript_62800:221-1186(-)
MCTLVAGRNDGLTSAAGSAFGELRMRLGDRRAEVAALRAHIQQARLDTQQLLLRLKALGVADPSLVPGRVQAGSGAVEPQHVDLQSLLQWLADSVDLSQQVVFECGGSEGEVTVSGRRVQLSRMAAWQLSSGSTAGLRLSVPLELQAEIAGMLSSAQRRGRVDEAQVQRLASLWEVVGAEVVSATMGQPEPAIFLVHRESTQAVVVAQWPAVEFARAAPADPFDPERHFARLAEAECDAEAGAVAPRPQVSTGDRVEVEYEGQWFAGVIEWVDGDIANVKCDVDSPGVITVAPLTNVRPARAAQHAAPKKMQRHMRARSVG